MASIQVEVGSAEQKRLVELVATFAAMQDHINIVWSSNGQQLALKDGQTTLHGINTICRYLADSSKNRERLLGGDEAAKAQISEWLALRTTGLFPITEEILLKISEHLLTRMYLAHNSLSLADLCLYSALHEPLAKLPPSQASRYCNLVRWFDNVQHVGDKGSIYPRVTFTQTALPELPIATFKGVEAVKPANKAAVASTSGTEPSSNPKSSQTVEGQAAPAKLAAPAASSSSANGGLAADQSPAQPQQASKDAKQAKKEARKEAKKEADSKKSEEPRIDMLNIRVGKVVEVGLHPSADALYVEQIDVGEDQPRQVVSGLRNFVPLEKMQDRRVVVVTNLKPAKMRDVMSYGMVLCASNQEHDKVDPLLPPEAAAIGERVAFSGYSNDPLPEINPKKKILEKLKEDLQTDSVGVATYKSAPCMCAGGPVTSKIPSALVG